MSNTLRTTIFIVTAALLTIVAAFLFSDPADATPIPQLPGASVSAPVVDNPVVSNNGEGHDPDDMDELREHWRRPEYLADQHRQIIGIAVFCGSVAALGIIARRKSSMRAAL